MFSVAFWGLLVGRAASTLIGSILTVAIGWHLYEITGNAIDLALVGIFRIVPIIGLTLVGGWVADQFPRRNILMCTAVLQIVVIVTVAVFIVQNPFNKWHLLFSLSLLGVGRAFFAPAIQSVLPNIVPAQHLNRAVALVSSVWNLALTVGPLVAGGLLLVFDRDLYWYLLVLGLFTLIGFFVLPKTRIQEKKTLNLQELLGGVVFLRTEKVVLGAITIDLAIVLCGSVVAILPVFVKDILHAGPDALGLLRAMPAIGATFVGLVIAKRKTAGRREGNMLFVALCIFVTSIFILAFSTSLWIACLALLIYGGADMVSVVIRGTIVQALTPDHLRGRVSALNGLFIACSNDLGDARAGAAAAVFGVVNSLLLGGLAATLVLGACYQLFPGLRNLKTIAPPENDRL